MDFFERQYDARRKTFLLVVLFALTTILTALVCAAGLYIVVFWVLAYAAAEEELRFSFADFSGWLSYGDVFGFFLLFMVSISCLTYRQLRTGGLAVAQMLGARAVKFDTQNPDERRLLNVVEEMALASGTAVPLVYVMDNERQINALAAGYQVNEAVLIASRGLLERLSRDELQGVVAHEFSHILNGDMRINVRLIAVLAGALSIARAGNAILRAEESEDLEDRFRRFLVFLIGSPLFVSGYVGLFFGRLVKSASSRRREFLADATSVQFTRNPYGIAHAIWRIRHRRGSTLSHNHAESVSHMCFGQTRPMRLSRWLASHPPADERIGAVVPGYVERRLTGGPASVGLSTTTRKTSPAKTRAPTASFAEDAHAFSTTPEALTETIGNPTAEHVQYAHDLFERIPAEILDAAHGAETSRAAIYALLVAGSDEPSRNDAFAAIAAAEGDALRSSTAQLTDSFALLGKEARLPILEIAIASVKASTLDMRERLISVADRLVRADLRFTLFEYVLLTFLKVHLSANATEADQIEIFKFDPVVAEIKTLLSMLARVGNRDAVEASAVFRRAMMNFDIGTPTVELTTGLNYRSLNEATEKLRLLSPFLKRSMLNVCADCVLHDGKITIAEAELVRAIALAIDCPIPPLLEHA